MRYAATLLVINFTIFKVGKEFDALLIDVAANDGSGLLPVFDVFPHDSFKVDYIYNVKLLQLAVNFLGKTEQVYLPW